MFVIPAFFSVERPGPRPLFLLILAGLLLASCAPLPQDSSRPLPPPMPAWEGETPGEPAATNPAQQNGSANGLAAPGQRNKTPSTDTLQYRDFTYSPALYSARLFPEGEPLAFPALLLGASGRLELHFDELEQSVQPYRYRLLHCTRDWEPSELPVYEYLDGTEEVDIRDYSFSSLVKTPYVHYTARVPDPAQQLTRSGNYLLVVYHADYPDQPLISRRFVVRENVFNIDADVLRASGGRERDTHQQIRFRLRSPDGSGSNSFDQLSVAILQNGRWDAALRDVQPQFIRNAELVYERPEQQFYAGKEWRFVSLRSIRLLSERVQRISNRDTKPKAELFADEPRVYQPYNYRADMNGQYFVAVDESDRDELEAEYVTTEFFLPFPAPLYDGSIYWYGARSEYRLDSAYAMTYDFDRKGYTISLLLKQGYYNYQYVFSGEGSSGADFGVVEGNWFETENEYQILVYWRDLEGRYDRLAGFTMLRSNQR